MALEPAELHQPRARREAILDAAARRFASSGFDGASVRDIAADAGLKNQASLYQYFPDKHALYEATINVGIEDMLARLGAPSPLDSRIAASRERGISSFLDDIIDYLVENPHIAALIQGAGADRSPFVRDALPRLLHPLYEEGLRLLSPADHRWNQTDVPHLAAALYHLIFGYFANPSLMEIVLGIDPTSDAAIAQQRRFLKIAVTSLIGDKPNASISAGVASAAFAPQRP